MLTASINKLNHVMGDILKAVHAIQVDKHKALDDRPVEGDKADPKLDALQVSHSTRLGCQKYASGSCIRLSARSHEEGGLVGVMISRDTTCLSAPTISVPDILVSPPADTDLH